MASSKQHIVLVGGDGCYSGVPRHITHLVAALRERSQITVLSETCRGGFAEARALGARHVAIDGLSSSFLPTRWWQGRNALVAYLREHPADLVWSHARMPNTYLRQSIVSGHWNKPHGTRLALTYHGLPYGAGHRIGTSGPAKWVERKLLSTVPPLDTVFLTDAHKHQMQETMGSAIDRHRCHVLQNCSDLGSLPTSMRLAPRPFGLHLVMTGRVGWQKNYPAALRLMRYLPDDIRLSVCGAGTRDPKFLRLIKRLAGPAASRIRSLGPLADVRPLLSMADGYMLLSRYEGQPIGALEASEYGLPLIVTPFAGVEDLTKLHPMALILSGDQIEQAESVVTFLAKFRDRRAEIQARIRTFWENHHSPKRFATSAQELVFETFGIE